VLFNYHENRKLRFPGLYQFTLTPFSIGHIPIDADVTSMDNSGSHKAGFYRTYKGNDGCAPMAVYIEQKGYCLDFEFR
jgi:hypothetical protein